MREMKKEETKAAKDASDQEEGIGGKDTDEEESHDSGPGEAESSKVEEGVVKAEKADDAEKEPLSYQEYNARKAKKQQTARSVKKGEATLSCGTCYEEFPSRNKLFDHLKETNHAMFKEDKGGKKKKGKK
eukprot:TRINITY_DN33811_c0_g1_i1.p1 TRINITY_DN33811_c0_g1~~TRINITY_DN33811_c0_g1_i1.p1  ORF type:complete len:151 (+),score=86.65 TRINITY_DN33811_c0_g1_i1:66-455(+)